MNSPQIFFFGVVLLIGIGLYGLLILRHLIRIVIALQILVKGTILALVIAGQITGELQLAQSLALTVITVDTIVAIVGLALAIQIQRQFGTLDLTEAQS